MLNNSFIAAVMGKWPEPTLKHIFFLILIHKKQDKTCYMGQKIVFEMFYEVYITGFKTQLIIGQKKCFLDFKKIL